MANIEFIFDFAYFQAKMCNDAWWSPYIYAMNSSNVLF